MPRVEQVMQRIQELLEQENLTEAEKYVDTWAHKEPRVVAQEWGIVGQGDPVLLLSHCYNSIGAVYQNIGMREQARGNSAAIVQTARGAERCHEKAFDLFDMSAEDVLFLPSDPQNPYIRNFVYTFWGLGAAKYILDKEEESRQYLLLCLRMPAADEQGVIWQADASTYLRLMDRKPIQIAVRVTDISPNGSDQGSLFLHGEVLEWGQYTKPRQNRFLAQMDMSAFRLFAAIGITSPLQLPGHVVVMHTDTSGDLERKLRVVEIV